MPELTKVQTGFLEPQGPFKLDPGTESAPGIYFEGDENTGLYRSAEDELAVSVAGIQKAKFNSDGLVGNVTGNLTGNVTGNLTGESTIQSISSEIADTAVDIFIYDTSKDSDGGAWRKRTQHTSWYNETLNTATRGARREFPAVAVIVATTSKVTIYDGDDPDLPMWMVFNNGRVPFSNPTVINWFSSADAFVYTASILNSKLVVGTNGACMFFDFSGDYCQVSYNTGNYKMSYVPVVYRNDYVDYGSITSGQDAAITIINPTVNDVAMTVLPNAPLDPATGLPIPTIAVATNGGVSVIKDDGSVVDVIDTNSARKCYDVSFTKDHKIMHTGDLGAGSTHAGNVFVTNVLTADRSEYDNHSDLYRWYSTSSMYPRINGGNTFNTRVLDPLDVGGHHYAMADVGISLIEDGTSSSYGNTDGMVAYAATSYNTGWMHGDIKLATLSDTDTTNLSATDLGLITNGDFSNGITGWSSDQIFTVSGGVASIQRNAGPTGQCYQTITTEIGRTYTVGVLVSAVSNGFQVYKDAGFGEMSQGAVNATGTHYWSFTATSTSTRLDFSAVQNGTATASFDNITIFDGVADRSVNNTPVNVTGTITKSAVATGAELVAYSGFSVDTNFLRQPYNSDLDFGTGDFSVTGWFKMSDVSTTGFIFDRANVSSGGSRIAVYTEYSLLKFYTFDGSANTEETSSISGFNNVWVHFVTTRSSNGYTAIYLNGNLKDSMTATSKNVTNTSASTTIGARFTGASGSFSGSIALLRISGSIPSPEQIKKIYEDEKFLFQENAACTLYGSSDAVTALAYDEVTERLHVGTSSGRSEFQGLRRINNTTTAVTTAISAYDSFVVEQ